MYEIRKPVTVLQSLFNKKTACTGLLSNALWFEVDEEAEPEVQKARTFVSMGKMDAAIAVLTGALLEKPQPHLYRLLALCYRSESELEEAEVMEELAARHS